MSETAKDRSVFDVEPLRPDHAHIWAALSELNGRVATLVDVIGKPQTADGGVPATGIFSHINGLDRRMKRFERWAERGLGGLAVAAPMITALWWLAGDKIAKLFHG